jgi:predicted ArsR family transcriptional regulator
VPALELLVAVHRGPSNSTTVPQAATLLDVSRGQVRDTVKGLEERGLVSVSSDEVKLATPSIDVRLAIADLASLYSRDRELVLDVLRVFGRTAA